MKNLIIHILYFLFPFCTYAQGNNYAAWQKAQSQSYQDWEKKQDWEHNYFVWQKKTDEEYNRWLKENGWEGEVRNESKHTSKPTEEDIKQNQIDSLQALIQSLQNANQGLESQNQNLQNQISEAVSIAPFKVWAVIVGVSHYDKEEARLNYCDDDAYKIYAFLKSPEGGALPDEQIKLFIDEEAQGHNIKQALSALSQKATKDDVFLFYFSGHGTPESLLAKDFDTRADGQISHNFVAQKIDESPAKLGLCIIDACHSGNIARMQNQTSDTPQNQIIYACGQKALTKGMSVQALERQANFYEAFKKSEKGRAYILSSKGEEVSLEASTERQGVFSYYFIKGLKGAADYNSDKIISLTECFDYTRKKVRELTKMSQNPIMTGDYSHTMPFAMVR